LITIATPTPKPLYISVMFDEVQLGDIIGIDIFGNISAHCVNEYSSFDPSYEKFKAVAVPIQWYFIAPTLEPTPTTPEGFKVVPNTTYDTCPRDLDIVITGGPSPRHRPESSIRFIKEAWETTRVWITTCIGSTWVADAGVFNKGQKATANRTFLGFAKQMYLDVEWLD
jgi:putative intracellular protease/amidase